MARSKDNNGKHIAILVVMYAVLTGLLLAFLSWNMASTPFAYEFLQSVGIAGVENLTDEAVRQVWFSVMAGTYGTTEALVRDKFGVPNVIKFFRPVETPVYATVTIRPFPGYLSTTGESIRKNVAEHINGLNIGDDVSLSRLYSPANAANAASYDIESITLGTSQGAQSAANVAVAFNAVASCSVDRVKLVVRP